eukprot:scaffold60551_cov30-Tisochrysis_lutea.AAC.3
MPPSIRLPALSNFSHEYEPPHTGLACASACASSAARSTSYATHPMHISERAEEAVYTAWNG